MMRYALVLTLLSLGLAVIRPGAASRAQPPGPPEVIQRVLVISLDGARPDALQRAAAPHIQRLAGDGAVTWAARTVFPPATVPAHASLLTGLDVPGHGIDWNDYAAQPIDVPTMLDHAIEHGRCAALIAGKEKFSQFVRSVNVVYRYQTQGDRSVTDAVVEQIQAGCELIVAAYPNPDYFGHLSGWMSETYLYELRNTDYEIGRVLEALAAHDAAAETLIVLTADHGGHGTVHGADIPEDMTIPLILSGAGVQPGSTLPDGTSITRIAPTALWALGLPLPPQMPAPLWHVFQPAERATAPVHRPENLTIVWTENR